MSANLARMLALAATVAAFLASAALCQAQTPPSAAEAEAFVAKAEADLAAVDEYESRAAWVQETYINDDTNWLLLEYPDLYLAGTLAWVNTLVQNNEQFQVWLSAADQILERAMLLSEKTKGPAAIRNAGPTP